MRKFLIPIAAIAASAFALAAPASASPRWAGNSYGYGYSAAPMQPMYGYGYGNARRMERLDHRMDRQMMRTYGNRGYSWNSWGGRGRGRHW